MNVPQDEVNRMGKLATRRALAQSIFSLDSVFKYTESKKPFLHCKLRDEIVSLLPSNATKCHGQLRPMSGIWQALVMRKIRCAAAKMLVCREIRKQKNAPKGRVFV